MRAVIQRVASAHVAVQGEKVAEIRQGIVVLVGFADGDGTEEIDWMSRKIAVLRIFEDEVGKMNLPLGEVEGKVLVVPNFTLSGDVRKGRRPSFSRAAPAQRAEKLFDQFVSALRAAGVAVVTGHFGAAMRVTIVNDGPATFIVDTEQAK